MYRPARRWILQSALEIEGRDRQIQGRIPNVPPDVRQQADLKRPQHVQHAPHEQPHELPRSRVTASTIGMVDWHGICPANLNAAPTLFPMSTGTQIAIPQNYARRKFILINNDPAVNMYFSYKNAPFSLIPLFAGGGVYVEQGNDVSRDDIYIWCTASKPYGAYEGVPDISDEGLH